MALASYLPTQQRYASATCLHPCLEKEVHTGNCVKIAAPWGMYIFYRQLLLAKPPGQSALGKHSASPATAGR